jgi:hypothetical protein
MIRKMVLNEVKYQMIEKLLKLSGELIFIMKNERIQGN